MIMDLAEWIDTVGTMKVTIFGIHVHTAIGDFVSLMLQSDLFKHFSEKSKFYLRVSLVQSSCTMQNITFER